MPLFGMDLGALSDPLGLEEQELLRRNPSAGLQFPSFPQGLTPELQQMLLEQRIRTPAFTRTEMNRPGVMAGAMAQPEAMMAQPQMPDAPPTPDPVDELLLNKERAEQNLQNAGYGRVRSSNVIPDQMSWMPSATDMHGNPRQTSLHPRDLASKEFSSLTDDEAARLSKWTEYTGGAQAQERNAAREASKGMVHDNARMKRLGRNMRMQGAGPALLGHFGEGALDDPMIAALVGGIPMGRLGVENQEAQNRNKLLGTQLDIQRDRNDILREGKNNDGQLSVEDLALLQGIWKQGMMDGTITKPFESWLPDFLLKRENGIGAATPTAGSPMSVPSESVDIADDRTGEAQQRGEALGTLQTSKGTFSDVVNQIDLSNVSLAGPQATALRKQLLSYPQSEREQWLLATSADTSPKVKAIRLLLGAAPAESEPKNLPTARIYETPNQRQVQGAGRYQGY